MVAVRIKKKNEGSINICIRFLPANWENSHQSVLLRGAAILQSVVKEGIRSFWFWRPKEPVEYGAGNCGKPIEKPIVEPSKCCRSKCLEDGYGKPVKKPEKRFFGSRKRSSKVMKEKPSNCKEVKPIEVKLTWWEKIFGPDPKRSWPDPCTCRLAHRRRRMRRAQDARLKDPRYMETAGDVFLYTEVMKRREQRRCEEPQPKPPPSFKVPKAVWLKNMCVDGTGPPYCEMSRGDTNACSAMRPFRIPYEEMRPPEKERRMFSCRRGIRSEDVLRPTRKDSYIYKIHTTAPQPCLRTVSDSTKRRMPPVRVTNNELNRVTRRRSRIEQLKFLIQKRDTLYSMSSTS